MAAVVALAGVATACSGSDPPPTPTDPFLAQGQELYDDQCASCHGRSGGGGIGPRLAGRVTDEYPDIGDQMQLIREGQGGMPAFDQSLSDEQLEAVARYTREVLGTSDER